MGSQPFGFFDFRAPGCCYNQTLNNCHALCCVESSGVADAEEDELV